MKRPLLKSIFFFLPFLLVVASISAEEQSVEEFMARLKTSFDSRDVSTFLDAFSPELREREKSALESMYSNFYMEHVTFHKVKKAEEHEGVVEANFQVIYQNEYSALVELWKLVLSRKDKGWRIERKEASGRISVLYKIKIPSGKVERVDSIEINHADIKIVFKDALLFYDNIPGLETALLVTGKGSFSFFPSDSREQHQLRLLFKTDILEDTLDYVYLRFSENFFQKNIKIEKASEKKSTPVSEAYMNRAYSLFHKHYSSSFTVESSLDGGLFSFLPQGEQAVFDFGGKKVGLMTYIYSPFSVDEITLINLKDEKLISLYSPSEPDNKKRLFISFSQQFDIKAYTIDIDFNPRDSFLSGRAVIDVESQVDSLDSLKLKFNSELSILRIFDEEKNELFYTQDRARNLLYVYLVDPPLRGESAKIEVFYRGKLEPPEQLADVIPSPQTGFEEKISLPPVYSSYLFSQSLFWYPSPPDVDYFQVRLRIIVPPQFICIANGELKESGRLDEVMGVEGIDKMGNSIFTFETKNPVKYISFIVGKFTKVEEDTHSLPIEIFISSNMRSQNRKLLEETRDILAFYQNLFGSFPYEKLSVVKRLWPTSGGHSPASFVVINELPPQQKNGYYVNVDSPVDLSRWSEYFIAHEIAHQWWGQGVTWASYRDQWLSEGLAQFSAVLYINKKRGSKVFSQILKKFSQWTEKKSFWGPVTMGSRLSYLDFDAYQSIVYNKSSLVLNMLREILGDEVFFKGLREYYSSHTYKVARTRDFVKSMEKVSGQDLSLFFDGWFDTHVLPEVRVTHSLERDAKEYIMKFELSQLKGHFVFPLWIEWRENGRREKRRVIITEKNARFEFRVKNKPEKIKINPEKAVPGDFY